MTHPTEQATPSRESRLREAIERVLVPKAISISGRPVIDAISSNLTEEVLAAVLPLMHEGVEERSFIERISKQKPETPDYWATCGQCERNIDEAQDLVAARQAAKD